MSIAMLLTLVFALPRALGCYTNTACDHYYKSALDQCFMKALADRDNFLLLPLWESEQEGFCYGGDAFTLNSGTCYGKKSLGEACTNADGGFDNNNCVSGLCSDTTQKCELRESGCASLANCVALGGSVALALAEYTGGSLISITNLFCPDSLSNCEGSMELSVEAGRLAFEVEYSASAFGDILTMDGTIRVVAPATLQLEADLVNPDIGIALYVPNVVLDFDIGFTLAFEKSASTEYSKDFVLSDELSVCSDPFNKKKACDPYIILSRVIKMGYATIDIEVGFQIVGSFTATVEASSDITFELRVKQEITVPEIGARVTGDGFELLGLAKVWDELASIDFVDALEVTAAGEAVVTADFELNVGPQLYVMINGIEFQGGLDFVFKAGAEFVASVDTGCASGGASMSFGLLTDFYSPVLDIRAGAEAACLSAVGFSEVNQVINVVQDITYDSYGTACAVEHLDHCDSRFNLCEEAAEFVGDVMDNFIDSNFALNPIFACAELFSVSLDLSTGFTVNGEKCNEKAELTDVVCPTEAHAYSGKTAPCSSSSDAFKVSTTLPMVASALVVLLYNM